MNRDLPNLRPRADVQQTRLEVGVALIGLIPMSLLILALVVVR